MNGSYIDSILICFLNHVIYIPSPDSYNLHIDSIIQGFQLVD